MKNLLIVDVDAGKNLIWVKGSVPGTRNGLVRLKATGEKEEKPVVLYTGQTEEKIEKKKPKEKKDKSGSKSDKTGKEKSEKQDSKSKKIGK